ncbi:MAG: hypothetical protein BroJett013_30500 [Alphaproteobacteria bacterium]|nr:MAG: hypothetical protein BroJett013_30500 [Alphaproteobacteria bacterium]
MTSGRRAAGEAGQLSQQVSASPVRRPGLREATLSLRPGVRLIRGVPVDNQDQFDGAQSPWTLSKSNITA